MSRKLTCLSDYAQEYVRRYGFALVPIEPKRTQNGDGTVTVAPMKAPWGDAARNWGDNAITDPSEAATFFGEHDDWNMGIVLGPSGYCSLDIDCYESFKTLMEDFGLDDELAALDSYPTIQGRTKGRRILFRVPSGELRYSILNWPSKLDPTGEKHRALMRKAAAARKAGDEEARDKIIEEAKPFAKYAVFELRAAVGGKQLQDVLPPSMHPDTGEPYKWITQPAASREDWPEPPDWLYAIWTAWRDFGPQFEQACPWAPPKPEPQAAPIQKRSDDDDGVSVIQHHIDNTSLAAELSRYGYKQKGRGRKWLSPFSSTGVAGVYMLASGDRCYIHHASDPLCSSGSNQPVNAFDLYCYHEHGNNPSSAVKALAEKYGLRKLSRREQRLDSADATEPPPLSDEDAPPAIDEPTEEPPAPVSAPSGTNLQDLPINRGHLPTSAPFRALGYDDDRYFYLPSGTGQVTSVRRGAHTSPSEMLALASLEWWMHHYSKDPEKPSKGVDWQLAASDAMRACEACGIYNPDNTKGRGAWYDKRKKSVIIHLGDRLIVDGKPMEVHEYEGGHTFARAERLEEYDLEPASDEDSRKLIDLIARLQWKDPQHAMFLAGWIALAVICGALVWRPHLWLHAVAGAGKSWTQDSIIRQVLGRLAVSAQGATTEAGIRQRLKQDARPVLQDEAEAETKRTRQSMQSIIELMRQSSSESAYEILKGTVSGSGLSFRAQSMFLLSSINVSLNQAADVSRVTLISLEKNRAPNAAEVFAELEYATETLLTDDYCASIRARSYAQVVTIRHNAQLLAEAIGEVARSRRIGDQIGHLVAGWVSLQHRNKLTEDEAQMIAASLDLEAVLEVEEESDERRLVSTIMQHGLQCETRREQMRTFAIAELILVASEKGGQDLNLDALTAKRTLARWGIRVDKDTVTFANRHTGLAKILEDSSWAAGWKSVLERIPGATTPEKPAKYGAAASRGTAVPFDELGIQTSAVDAWEAAADDVGADDEHWVM